MAQDPRIHDTRNIQPFGPAMEALDTRQKAFVMIMWEQAPISAKAAAAKAGYSDIGNSAGTQAYRLMHSEKIRAAMIEYGRGCQVEDAPELKNILMKIARNPQNKDQAKVALAMYNRAGFHDIVENTTNININITKSEKIAQIRQTLLEQGKTDEEITALFGGLADYEVEGEFKDVTGTAEDPYANEQY
jgi:hypothetical protein